MYQRAKHFIVYFIATALLLWLVLMLTIVLWALANGSLPS